MSCNHYIGISLSYFVRKIFVRDFVNGRPVAALARFHLLQATELIKFRDKKLANLWHGLIGKRRKKAISSNLIKT